jgi:hypothetical protein
MMTGWSFGVVVAVAIVLSVASLIDYAQGRRGPTIIGAVVLAAFAGGLLGWWFL